MEELPRELQEASKAAVEVALPSPRELTLNVEDALRQRRNENDKYTCTLQGVAVEFVENLSILPLTTCSDYLGKYPSFPGVYLIYYIGETSLYEDLVRPSRDQPIYVGKSNNDILNQLNDHRRKVVRADDLEVTDFVVRFMILDIKTYVASIEASLIEYYNPLWNSKTVKFYFGNAKDPKNNWHTYHVAKVKCKRKEMIKRVKEYQYHKLTSTQSDHHASENPTNGRADSGYEGRHDFACTEYQKDQIPFWV